MWLGRLSDDTTGVNVVQLSRTCARSHVVGDSLRLKVVVPGEIHRQCRALIHHYNLRRVPVDLMSYTKRCRLFELLDNQGGVLKALTFVDLAVALRVLRRLLLLNFDQLLQIMILLKARKGL